MKKLVLLFALLTAGFVSSIQAQMLNVSGYVTDSSGSPVPNVTIFLTDTTLGAFMGATLTDANGFYIWHDTVGFFPMPVGSIDVMMLDCNGNIVIQSFNYTPNTISIVANFNYCVNGGGCSVAFTNAAVSGNSISATATPQGGVAPYSYLWDMGDGTTFTTPSISYTYNTPGIFNACVTVTDANGCVAYSCINIGGVGACYADFYYYYDSLNAMTLHFFDSGTSGFAPYTYSWDFGDGNTSNQANPTHTFAQQGVYTVCLTVTDATGCVSQSCYAVWVYPTNPCTATITAMNNPMNPNEFFFSVSGFSGNGFAYGWDFGDGTIDTTNLAPAHTYTQSGIYHVCFFAIDTLMGCFIYECTTIQVGTTLPCYASIQYFNQPGSADVDFYAYASGTAPFTYNWNFGDGTTSNQANPTHTYNTSATGPVTFIVSLTVTDANGCVSSDSTQVLIFNSGGMGSIGGFVTKDSFLIGNADATVYLIEYDTAQGTLTAIDTVQTQQGTFVFNNVPNGTYLLKAALNTTDPDYANYMPTYFYQELQWSNAFYVFPLPLPLGIPVYDIQLIAGNNPGGAGFIGGLISNGAGRPYVLTTDEKEDMQLLSPMAGMSVLLLDENENPVAHTVSANDGTYSFSNIPLGTFTVHVEEVGMIAHNATVTLTANAPSSHNVDFTVYENMVVLTATYDVKNTITELKVFPNPVVDVVNVEVSLENSADVTMTLTNLMGQTFISRQTKLQAGENRLNVEMNELPAGMYFLNLQTGSEVRSFKLTKNF